MYRNKHLSPPNALDIPSAHSAHGSNGNDTTVSPTERLSEMAKGNIQISGQSEQDFGLDLRGVKLDFDTKLKCRNGNEGHKHDVSAVFQHKQTSCNVYVMNMTTQAASGWFISNQFHKYQFKPIVEQLENMHKEVPHYMRSWSEPGLRKGNGTDTY